MFTEELGSTEKEMSVESKEVSLVWGNEIGLGSPPKMRIRMFHKDHLANTTSNRWLVDQHLLRCCVELGRVIRQQWENGKTELSEKLRVIMGDAPTPFDLKDEKKMKTFREMLSKRMGDTKVNLPELIEEVKKDKKIKNMDDFAKALKEVMSKKQKSEVDMKGMINHGCKEVMNSVIEILVKGGALDEEVWKTRQDNIEQEWFSLVLVAACKVYGTKDFVLRDKASDKAILVVDYGKEKKEELVKLFEQHCEEAGDIQGDIEQGVVYDRHRYGGGWSFHRLRHPCHGSAWNGIFCPCFPPTCSFSTTLKPSSTSSTPLNWLDEV